MTETITDKPVRTIADMLAEGRTLYAARQNAEREARAKAEQERQERWFALLCGVEQHCGELVQELSSVAPENFFTGTPAYTIAFRPFDAARISCTFEESYNHEAKCSDWRPRRNHNDLALYLVPTDFRPEDDPDLKEGGPEATAHLWTDNIAEALAACEAATAAYQRAKAAMQPATECSACGPKSDNLDCVICGGTGVPLPF